MAHTSYEVNVSVIFVIMHIAKKKKKKKKIGNNIEQIEKARESVIMQAMYLKK